MPASSPTSPPYTITQEVVLAPDAMTPHLRRDTRLRTIHATLAIENNTLSLEQVTAIIAGKRVLGPPRDILEVKNASVVYERLDQWDYASEAHLLEAHRLLMAGLIEDPGRFRTANVGVFRGQEVVHLGPPANRVPGLIRDLLAWLQETGEHPLIASCVAHYELELIHPFADGNGRIGRLWQTLILSRWKALLAYLPVETMIHSRQDVYYQALKRSDNEGEATPFMEFILKAILDSLFEMAENDQVGDQASDQVRLLLQSLEKGEANAASIMDRLGLSHRPTFRKNYLNPALDAGLIERTQPDSPRSPTQKYRLTAVGQRRLADQEHD